MSVGRFRRRIGEDALGEAESSWRMLNIWQAEMDEKDGLRLCRRTYTLQGRFKKEMGEMDERIEAL